MGVESIAVNPSNPNRLYMACGTYTIPFGRPRPNILGGNENGRGNGEGLAVDPGDGRILFLGTRYSEQQKRDMGHP